MPGPAPADLSDATVNFANPGAADADARCTRDRCRPDRARGQGLSVPHIPAGAGTTLDGQAIPGLAGSRSGFVVHAANATLGEVGAFGTWAYTAP